MLSTILRPVSAREDFLHHIKHTALPGGSQDVMDNVWVVVDSSGEEEEDPSQLWAAFTENDVIQVCVVCRVVSALCKGCVVCVLVYVHLCMFLGHGLYFFISIFIYIFLCLCLSVLLFLFSRMIQISMFMIHNFHSINIIFFK